MSRELRATIAILVIGMIASAPLIFADAPADFPQHSYLAMVFHTDPTNIPTPPPIKQLVNGDFEQGRDVGWTATQGSPRIVHTSALAHTGEWYAALGGSAKGFDGMGQEVTITADAPYLVYWSAVSSEEVKCTYDYGYVRSILIGTIDRVDEFCNAQEHGYRKRVVDLRRWIGYTVDLGFYMSTDVVLLSEWGIDDIRMQATP